ncbi:MAG: ZIP family metal transporter [Betaproteobacteria bacterium]|nr:ZIP family metal transporter [Betaproteobacteria bacterium]
MVLFYILAACLTGSLLSVSLAALLAWRIQPRLIPIFVSYAVGALLGVVFLDLLPHIFRSGTSPQSSAAWILAGILAFFLLEKLVLWRHSHDHADFESHAHAPSADHATEAASPATAWMVVIGDAFHNFTDGLAIAVAFLADPRLGIVTAVAIIAHEIPQELGNFLVLVHSGFSRGRALMWNLISSLATLAGAAFAYLALSRLSGFAELFLCLAAASMIYVAIADLIPGLHRRSRLSDSLQQILLITAGVGSIWLVNQLLGAD